MTVYHCVSDCNIRESLMNHVGAVWARYCLVSRRAPTLTVPFSLLVLLDVHTHNNLHLKKLNYSISCKLML